MWQIWLGDQGLWSQTAGFQMLALFATCSLATLTSCLFSLCLGLVIFKMGITVLTSSCNGVLGGWIALMTIKLPKWPLHCAASHFLLQSLSYFLFTRVQERRDCYPLAVFSEDRDIFVWKWHLYHVFFFFFLTSVLQPISLCWLLHV